MIISIQSKKRLKTVVVTICTLWVMGIVPELKAQTSQQLHKAKVAKKIYTQVARVARDSRKAPTFKFIYNKSEPYYNAYYNPLDNSINIGEGVYDIAAGFGKDSLNVLAAIVGHELAHFYKDHGWGWSFGMANKDLEIAKKIYKLDMTEKRRAEMETEADYFGGLFGYMAGYNTLAVSKKFLTQLYKKIGLKEKTEGYPSLSERIGIARNTQKKLQKLVPVFDAANYLTMIRSYERASACYSYIGSTFPGREIYNNSGVALAQQAIQLFEKTTLKYFYPFGLDTDTRLNNAGTRAGGETRQEKRTRLLKEALEDFKSAVYLDKNYVAGYVNLALANELLEERALAIGYATKAIKLAKKQGLALLEANAWIAKGIAQAKEGDTDEAKESFKKAQKANPTIAKINLEALKKANRFGYGFEIVKSKEKPGPKESIAEADLSMLEVLTENAQKIKIRKRDKKRPAILLKTAQDQDEGYAVMEVTSFGIPKTKSAFLRTLPGYEGNTARGIKIGDPLSKVLNKYGEPGKRVASTQSTILVYLNARIMFMIDAQKSVSGWMLYKD
ncbi:M48 family metalloprotease [uncultured Microscilla sp.]|uniref:M48 family metalloprotease n=1 Tax=uncultured Microscilla sp. TaxID=432653 RepID=UPI0026176107|nr:M48 family metalloprotease [uncultured Microscilla sp.]